ncbi:class I SAM-dependent methyltransferase [Dongia rigui]|uniref:Methyltransferase domain-containing protein n=1 Tax=Dongia rigui TaxID=940149 RepID=A0ABU5E2W4_9PROT|nr:methyltransferase domain-containing protein [Dongia rigui]MDY0873151.1 methyltransferase domain-containing protein [Dongia rigui]
MTIRLANHSLKEDIRQYWSDRAQTFDLAFGHRIPAGAEFDAWRDAIAAHLGHRPLHVLELACGTGEVTQVLLSLGHQVTALDFSESMLAVARKKHAGKERNLRFILGDAENTFLPSKSFDAIVCRHLVWTLTAPATALQEWRRLLKPAGQLLIFDGDWSRPRPSGRLAASLIGLLDRWQGPDLNYDGAMSERHAGIMSALPFGDGLTAERLMPLLVSSGFSELQVTSHAPIARAQRRAANLRNKLRTFVYRRFILSAKRA